MVQSMIKKEISAGFTVIELLTVLAIIGLIAAFVVPNFREGQRKADLRRAAQKVAQDIRRAQIMAMSGVDFTSAPLTCGYGVHYVDDNTYIIFKDMDDDCDPVGIFNARCDSASSSCEIVIDGAEDEIVETIIIPEIEDVKFAGSFPDILFVPPEPLTYVNGFYPNEAAIFLQSKSDPSIIKSIEVELTGNVKIE